MAPSSSFLAPKDQAQQPQSSSANHSFPIPTSTSNPPSPSSLPQAATNPRFNSIQAAITSPIIHHGDPKVQVRLTNPHHARQASIGLRRAASRGDIFTDMARSFHQSVLIDTTPLPEDVPAVKEVGASSAPLLSASFFIGARCRDYNDDYMQCKTEKPGRGEFDCMKEGRRVTRCASSVYVLLRCLCLTH
jgi:hypothetical protein